MTFKVVLLIAIYLVLVPVYSEAHARKEPVEFSGLEERLNTLEDRLLKLEKGMELVLQGLEKLTPAGEQVRDLTDSSVSLLGEVRELTAEVEAEAEFEKTITEKSSSQKQFGTIDQNGFQNKPFGGYMEMHLNHDNINPTVLDFHRFVLLYSHQFNNRIRFVGELEIEHALVEGGEESGELELEQAYLDFMLSPALSFRAGMMITPMGIVNERHEPASFNGVERPFVDSVIIPTTWFGQGAGLVGDLGRGFSFKAFGMSSLNSSFFSANQGFQGGKQKGFFDTVSHVAGVGRLEYAGIPDLNLGVSFWAGETGFDFDLSGKLQIFEFDGEWRWKRFSTRGQFVITSLTDAEAINRSLQLKSGINPNIAEAMRGFYLEGGFQLFPIKMQQELVSFYRYENFNTQHQMPAGFLPLNQFDRSAHVIGLTYFPHPDIAFKFDYNFMRNASSVVQVPNRWNFGLGWWF